MTDDPEIQKALRYVVGKPNCNGTTRWYWQRRGHKPVKLDRDPVKRIAQARLLNIAADGEEIVADGSVAWAIAKYRSYDKFAELAASTIRIYNRWLKEIEELWGKLPCSAITAKVVMGWRDDLPKHGSTRIHALAVLANVLEVARKHDYISVNPAKKPDIKRPKPRDQIWSEAEIKRFLDACDEPGVTLAFQILRYTAQRPIDVCKMTWTQYEARFVNLRQQKTGKLVSVRCHMRLQAVLAQAPRTAAVICVTPSGRAYKREELSRKFREIANRVGLAGLQLRDLRRTAMVRLGEIGVPIQQIAAVSGHTIEQTQRILETYLPRTAKMSEAAILAWEQNSEAESDASEKIEP